MGIMVEVGSNSTRQGLGTSQAPITVSSHPWPASTSPSSLLSPEGSLGVAEDGLDTVAQGEVISLKPFCKVTLLLGEWNKGGAHPSNWINFLTSSALPRVHFSAPQSGERDRHMSRRLAPAVSSFLLTNAS